MAASIYFFASFDQLDDAGTGNGQPSTEAFGPDTNHTASERFLVSSVHKRKQGSTDSVKAIAVVDGYVVAQPDSGNSAFTTIYLKPKYQPSEVNGITLPKVKYFVYRGVITTSLFDNDTTDSPGLVATDLPTNDPNHVDLVHYISTHETPPILATALLPTRTTALGIDTPIEFSFNNLFLDPNDPLAVFPNSAIYNAGDSIGVFDPASFSFEIILDDLNYEPTVADATTASPGYKYIDVPLASSSGNGDMFVNWNAKEAVLHYLDPAAFYGSIFGATIKAKDTSGTVLSFNSANFQTLIAKFYNREKVYVDIRNEHNLSFNYYRFVTSNDYYAQYSNNISLELQNTQGSNTGAIDYYASGWPLLVIDTTSSVGYPSGNSGSKNIVRLKLPVGNNLSPILIVSTANKNSGAVSDPFEQNEFEVNERFMELTESSGEYGVFETSIPNLSNNTTTPLATYVRLKYCRRLPKNITYDVGATSSSSNIPPPNEVQFLDNIFQPFDLVSNNYVLPPFVSNEIATRVFDEERYVDLSQSRQVGVECVANVGIAEDNSALTLFAFSKYRNANSSNKFTKDILKVNSQENSNGNSFLISFVDRFIKEKLANPILDSPDFGMNPVAYLQRPSRKGLFRTKSISQQAEGEDLIAIVLDKTNFRSELSNAISGSGFTSGFPVRLSVINRNDRDDNPGNEQDSNEIDFFRCSLALRGFSTSGSTVTEIVHPLAVNTFAVRQQEDQVIQPILQDSLVTLDGPVIVPYVCAMQIHRDINRPIVTFSQQDHTHNLGDVFNVIYKEDLTDFIQRLYTLITTNATLHYSSFVSYAYAMEDFIIPSGNTTYIAYGSNVSPFTGGENIIIPANPLSLNFVPGVDPPPPDPDSGGPGCLVIPPIRSEGALVEAAMALAIYKMDKDLTEVQRLLDRVIQGNFSTFRASFNDTMRILRETYPFFNNLSEIYAEKGIPWLDYRDYLGIRLIRSSMNAYYGMYDPSNHHDKYIADVSQAYKDHNGTRPTADKLLEIAKAVTAEKAAYINSLSRCIFLELGGSSDCFNLGFVGIGDGSPTLSLFESQIGVGLSCYELSEGDQDSVNTSTSPKITIPLGRSPGMNRVLHFGVYGLNNGSGAFNRFTINAYRNSNSRTPAASMIVGGAQPTTSRTLTWDLNPPPGLGEPPVGAQLSYTTAPQVPNTFAGTFNDVTKELTVTDDSIDYLVIEKQASLEDMVFLYASYCAPPDFHYARSFENLFEDDGIHLPQANVDRMFEGMSQEKIASLMKYINAATSFTFDLTGGFIGRTRIPWVYDPLKPGGYKQGDLVTFSTLQAPALFYPHNSSIYRATVNIATGIDPDNSTDWEELVVAAQVYAPGDIVRDGDTFWTATKTFTSSGNVVADNTVDPSRWGSAISRFVPGNIYTPGIEVVANGVLYRCIKSPLSDSFNVNEWLLISRVESDSRYAYDPNNNWAPSDPNYVELGQAPAVGSLEYDTFPRLRYAYMSMEYLQSSGEFKISVEAYASPLRSRLDAANPPLSTTSVTALTNPHTIYGQNNNTDAKLETSPGSGVFIPSYNQVLTALRCFQLIEGVISKLAEFEITLPQYAGASNRLSTEASDPSVTVQTTVAGGTGNGIITDQFIDFTFFNGIN